MGMVIYHLSILYSPAAGSGLPDVLGWEPVLTGLDPAKDLHLFCISPKCPTDPPLRVIDLGCNL